MSDIKKVLVTGGGGYVGSSLIPKLLEANFDYNDTTGKSYEAAVGWITNKWRDPYVDPEEADLSEYWEEYDAEMEDYES